jgi:hypothetical protein
VIAPWGHHAQRDPKVSHPPRRTHPVPPSTAGGVSDRCCRVWPNKSRWLDEPMPSELLKAAVSGSIWRPQGGLGTLEQMHSPFRVPSRGVPPPRHQPHRGGPARQSSLYATPMERTSMIGAPKARSPWLPRRPRPYEFATSQKIRRVSTGAGPAAAEPATNRVADLQGRLPRAQGRGDWPRCSRTGRPAHTAGGNAVPIILAMDHL